MNSKVIFVKLLREVNGTTHIISNKTAGTIWVWSVNNPIFTLNQIKEPFIIYHYE